MRLRKPDANAYMEPFERKSTCRARYADGARLLLENWRADSINTTKLAPYRIYTGFGRCFCTSARPHFPGRGARLDRARRRSFTKLAAPGPAPTLP